MLNRDGVTTLGLEQLFIFPTPGKAQVGKGWLVAAGEAVIPWCIFGAVHQ